MSALGYGKSFKTYVKYLTVAISCQGFSLTKLKNYDENSPNPKLVLHRHTKRCGWCQRKRIEELQVNECLGYGKRVETDVKYFHNI